MTDKPALRAQLRARRDAFVATGHPTLTPPPAYLERLAPGTTVAAYAPVGSEADPATLISAARAAGCRIALPHVTTRAEPLRFLAWAEDDTLTSGPLGLRQPAADAAECDPDVILTPLVGFDAARNRLGQGAGHYDRAFARFPDAWRLGIAYSVQRVAGLPVEPWDVPLHAILTESELL